VKRNEGFAVNKASSAKRDEGTGWCDEGLEESNARTGKRGESFE